MTLRSVLFGVGAIGAVASAIDVAMTQGMTVLQLVAVGCTALAAYAAKWPTDVTKDEAQERVDRAVRRSIAPPPGDEQ